MNIFHSNWCNSLTRIHLNMAKCLSMRYSPKGPIKIIQALVQMTAGRPPGAKPLSELMMIVLLTHICITRPQWVNVRMFMHHRPYSKPTLYRIVCAVRITIVRICDNWLVFSALTCQAIAWFNIDRDLWRITMLDSHFILTCIHILIYQVQLR